MMLALYKEDTVLNYSIIDFWGPSIGGLVVNELCYLSLLSL